MEAREIQSLVPWRHPFLMIDRVIECTPHERIVTQKNVTASDLFADGDQSDVPAFPSVLLLEGMSQSAALLYKLSYEELPERLPLLGFLKASMHGPAVGGDSVRFHVRAIKMTRNGGLFEGESRLGERLIAEAELGFAASSALDAADEEPSCN